MDDMGMDMGGMSMSGKSMPSNSYYQQMFWAAVGTAVGIAVLVHVANCVLERKRLSATRRGKMVNHESGLWQSFATVTAIAREISSWTLPSVRQLPWKRRAQIRPYLTFPPLGRILLVSAELILVLILCFYGLDASDKWSWEDVGIRTGYISATQIPLVVLLAGKRNILGYLIGMSYERLVWLHRWVSRVLFVTVSIHMGFWFRDWAQYNYIGIKLATDKITQRGFAAWCILLWIVVSSSSPLRQWSYEFFVVQHIFTFAGFLAATYLHLPAHLKIYVWIPVALILFDRAVRAIFMLWNNLQVFTFIRKIMARRSHNPKDDFGLWINRATLEPLCGNVCRLTICDPSMTWKPGQHVFISCHGIIPLQSHPFTIASLPEDNRMEFLIQCKSGATRRLMKYARRMYDNDEMLPRHLKDVRRAKARKLMSLPAQLDGPYGHIRGLRQFDSVCFIAGSSGATFTMPLMKDIVNAWAATLSSPGELGQRKLRGVVTHYIRFVWILKSRDYTQWFAEQLNQTIEVVDSAQRNGHDVNLEISIYITCDAELEAPTQSRDLLVGDDDPDSQEITKAIKPIHSDTSATSSSPSPAESLLKSKARDIEMQLLPCEKDLTSESARPSASPMKIAKRACGSTGTCCCTKIIENEDDSAIQAAQMQQNQCRCSKANDKTTAASMRSVSSESGMNVTGPLLANHGIPSISEYPDKESFPEVHASSETSSLSISQAGKSGPTINDDKATKISHTQLSGAPGHRDEVNVTPRNTSPTKSLHPSIPTLYGRPAPKQIIRKMLEEQAYSHGESAVVVCGPPGLVHDTRRSVVQLSDERAVCKGTGAPGIYFWAEEFGY